MSDFFTVNQLAQIWKLHPITVRRYIREGKLRATKIGGRVRISKDSMESMEADQLSSPRRPRPKQIADRPSRHTFTAANPLWRLKGVGSSKET